MNFAVGMPFAPTRKNRVGPNLFDANVATCTDVTHDTTGFDPTTGATLLSSVVNPIAGNRSLEVVCAGEQNAEGFFVPKSVVGGREYQYAGKIYVPSDKTMGVYLQDSNWNTLAQVIVVGDDTTQKFKFNGLNPVGNTNMYATMTTPGIKEIVTCFVDSLSFRRVIP
jgi:hypothetical protein